MSHISNSLYEFGGLRFDAKRQRLTKGSEIILLSPKATEVLALLLSRGGEFVSKDEIFESVWADTFVEDGVLTQNIYTLRKALGDREDGNPIIENKPRLGYRITIPIIEAEASENGYTNGAASQINSSGQSAENGRKRSWRRFVVALVAVAIVFSVIGFVGYGFIRKKVVSYLPKPIETVKFQPLTNTGDLTNAALSPDGNLLAFARGDRMYLQDIPSAKEIQIEIPSVSAFSSIRFSSDSNFLYFRNTASAHKFAKILKTSRFGGDTKTVVEKSYAAFSLSPDNRSLAYYSTELPDLSLRLYIRDLETNAERELFQSDKSTSVCETCSPAWSPDGKKIIHINQLPGNQPSQIFLLDVATGNKEEVKLPRFRRFEQAAWFPEGNSFVISATENGKTFHLWKVDYPTGEAQAMTNGPNSYKNTIMSADGKKTLAVLSVENSNIFTAAEANLKEPKQLTTGNSNNFGQSSLLWINDDRIVFSSQAEPETVENLWSIDLDGRDRQQVTNETAFSASGPVSDGKFIYYSVNRNKTTNISRVSATGDGLTEITNETDGGRRSPQISPDGNWLYYIFRGPTGASKVMRRNMADQKEEVFFENEKVKCGLYLSISPDGNYLACTNWRTRTAEESEKFSSELAILPVADPSDVTLLPIANIPPIFHFSKDGRSIEFIAATGEGTQILRQGFTETTPKPVYVNPNGKIFNFAWSKSSKLVAFSQGRQTSDAILLTSIK